jgi:hypothetical protein
MMRWWPPLLHLALILGAGGLALLRFDALDTAALPPHPGSAETAARPAQGAAGMPETGGPEAAVDLAALAARPLFVAGRQPLATATETESPLPDMPPPAPEFRMVGYLNDGNRPRAILSPDPASPDVILREGDEIQGFTVFRISKDSIVLQDGDKEITINMFGQ